METTSSFPGNNNNGSSASSTVDNLASTAQKGIDRASDALSNSSYSVQNSTDVMHEKIDAAGVMARPAVDRILTGAHQAVDKLSGLATVAADTVSEKSVQLKEAHAKLMASGRDQVSEKPAVAVGIAVAAGIIIGRILSSRRS